MQYDGLKKTNPFLAFFAAISTATTTTGNAIPFAGYDSLVFHISAPILTTGKFKPKIMLQQKSDNAWVELTDQSKINGYPIDAADKLENAVLEGNADEGLTSKVGVYNVQDLYKAVRLDIVSSDTPVGTIHANAVLGHPNNFQADTQRPVL